MKQLDNGDLEVDGNVWERIDAPFTHGAWKRGLFELELHKPDWVHSGQWTLTSPQDVKVRCNTPEDCFQAFRDAARGLVML